MENLTFKEDSRLVNLYIILNLFIFFILTGVINYIFDLTGLNRLLNLSFYFGILIFVAILTNICKMVIDSYFTTYTLTPSRLEMQYGLFTLKKENIEYVRVIDISVRQPFLYRFFDLADIILHSSDHSCPNLVLTGIANHKFYLEEIRRYVDTARTDVSISERL